MTPKHTLVEGATAADHSGACDGHSWDRRSLGLAWCVIALGWLLRIARFADNRSLWDDEASLAESIVSVPFAELFGPLANDQGAPFGFLFLVRLVVDAWGPHEMALRLIPLIAGLASLPLFLLVLRRLLPTWAAMVALLLLAVSEPQIYYASEVKQYSCDVAFALAVIASFLHIDWRDPRPLQCAGLMLVCVWALCMSMPAVFVIAACCVVTLLLVWRQGFPMRWPIVTGSICAVAFAVCYTITLQAVGGSEYLRSFWKQWGGFMPMPPVSAEQAFWFLNTPFNYFIDPAGLHASGGLAIVLVALGCGYFGRNDPAKLAMLVVPILFTLFASMLERYPFSTSFRTFPPYVGRLILFTVPFAFILMAAGIELLRTTSIARQPKVATLAVIVILLVPGVYALKRLVLPPGHMCLRQQFEYFENQLQADDVVYLHWSAEPSFRYYRHRFPVIASKVVIGEHSRDDWGGYKADVVRKTQNHRTWFVFAHHPDFNIVNEKRTFRYLIQETGGIRAKKVDFGGGEVWLVIKSPFEPVNNAPPRN